MILTVDIGNANIVVCCVENQEKSLRFVLSADKNRSSDEYAALMALLAEQNGVNLRDISGAVIASVVPQLTSVASIAIERCTGCRPLLIGPGVKSGLNIRMDTPTELGGDLVAAAVAALEKYSLPCILIDFGIATAVGVIDATGSYVGGLICPGVSLSQYSLAKSASQLPDVSLDKPKRVIGKNTRDSMQSGIIHGAAAMIDGVIERIEEELGVPAASIVATGASADVIIPYCRRKDIVTDQDLVMRGLWSIWCRNRENT